MTTDTNLKHQQNLKIRHMAVVVLSTPSWPRIRKAIEKIARAIDAASAATFTEVEIP